MIQAALGSDLDAVISALSDQHAPTADAPLYLLLDEVQELPDWSKRLKAAWDRFHHRVRVLATGSSALQLIRPVEADFPGRIQRHTIHPMKFREVLESHPGRLKHANAQVWDEVVRLAKEVRAFIPDPAKDIQLQTALQRLHEFVTGQDPSLEPFLRNTFQEYAVQGGYPRARPGEYPSVADRRATFDQAFSAVLSKDVASLGIVKGREFTLLFRHLANNPGGKFVPATLASDLGVKHSTVSVWKRILEDAFLVQQLMPLKPNLRPHKSKDKAYLIDTGWFAHFRGLTEPSQVWSLSEFGLLVETVLVDHVRRLQYNLTKSPSLPLGYIENPEVDVAANLGQRWLLLEAKYRSNPKRSVLNMEAPPGTLKVVATRTHFELPKLSGGAYYLPAHEWALVA